MPSSRPRSYAGQLRVPSPLIRKWAPRMRCCCFAETPCSVRLRAVLLVGFAPCAGGLLSRRCFSELGALLAVQVFLILLWCLFRRPLVVATRLYVLGCSVLLVRETFLLVSGRVPCGLSTFGYTCKETVCTEYNRIPIFGIKTSCARYECSQREHKEVSQVFTSPESVNKWTATALGFVWAAVVTSLWQFQLHGRRASSARRENPGTDSTEFQYTSVILAVPITYGLCSLHALRVLSVNPEDAWQAEGMMSAAELYSAVALLAFQKLLEVYVKEFQPGKGDGCIDIELDCEACPQQASEISQHTKVLDGFQQLVAMGLKQYVVLVFGCNALEMIAKTWNWANPARCRTTLALVASTWFPHHEISLTLNISMVENTKHTVESSIACEDLWNTVSLLMVVANFFTCSIALYAVLQYERAFSAMLEPVRPFWKFWGVKGLLSVNFLQRLVLMALGTMASRSLQLNHEFRTFLNFFLVCVESALLAMLNIFAYAPASDESNACTTEPQSLAKPCPTVLGSPADLVELPIISAGKARND